MRPHVAPLQKSAPATKPWSKVRIRVRVRVRVRDRVRVRVRLILTLALTLALTLTRGVVRGPCVSAPSRHACTAAGSCMCARRTASAASQTAGTCTDGASCG